MCSPDLGVGEYLAIAGTTATMAGQIQQGQNQNAIMQHNAQVANAQVLDAQQRGAVQEGQQIQKTQQLMGAQTAAMGSSGAAVESQSFGKVLEQSSTMGALDALTIRQNADREAWSASQQATGFKMQGDAAEQMGYASAAGTALTGFGQAYKMGQMKKYPYNPYTGKTT